MEDTFKQDYISEFVDELARSLRSPQERTDRDEFSGDSGYLDSLLEVFS